MKRVTDMTQLAVRSATRHWVLSLAAVAVLIGGALGYLVGEHRFSDDRVAVLRETDTYIDVLSNARIKREARPALDGRLQSIANRTLGPSLENVDSEVRRRLNRACEELGIAEFSVTTGSTTARATPAKKEFRRPEERQLRDEPDFVEVQATVIASGSAAQVYQLLFKIDIEPWIKRIESIRLDPNNGGEAVKLTIKLTTIFLPGRLAKAPLVIDQQALATAERYRALFGSNPFRIPPPIAPTVIATNATSGAPTAPIPTGLDNAAGQLPVAVPLSPFPYGEWQLTGVVEGPSGPELWLRHLPTGTPLTLQPGSAIGELIFRAVEYDSGLFEGPGGTCRVQVGNNLTQRASAAG